MPNKMSAQDIFADCLSCQKHLTSLYNMAALEANSDELRSALINILGEEHQLHSATYKIMAERNMYKTKPASLQELKEVQQQYGNPQMREQYGYPEMVT